MKVQATVLLAFQAKSLAEAGAVLDDVLTRARERDDVDVGRVELLSPPGDRAVTLPPVTAPLGYQPNVPPRRAPETARSLALGPLTAIEHLPWRRRRLG
jgi:hypothetical protein